MSASEKRISPLASLLLALTMVAGCQPEPPPLDKPKLQQELKQLDEHHQKEAANQPYIQPETPQ